MYREVRWFNLFCWTLFRAREAFASLLADHAKQLLRNPEDRLPFHLHMMECLLDETCSFFHQKVERWFKSINVMYNFSWGFLLLFILAFCFQNRLKLVTERILEELTNDVNIGGYAELQICERLICYWNLVSQILIMIILGRLQRLLPLKRALTEVEHDVRDTHETMDQVIILLASFLLWFSIFV